MIKVSIDRKIMKSVMSGVANQIKSKIDINQVKKLCKKQYGIETINGIEHKDANIVVIKNQFACRLDLEVRFPMSILISTREDSNSTSSDNNYIPEEFADAPEDFDDMLDDFDDIPEELQIPEEFDDVSEELEIPEDFNDIPEELDIAEELDEMMGEDIDDMDRLKKQPLIGKDIKKPN
ncbi:MAG: hypothetical protein OET18_10300 [Desulfobacterales bacterium]|jgi:hypothetical protein|nr:hypothetical protein [Desulfobacteraceae bacterium]MDH3878224.1 hypothetical protein [Desulfobacterales bacterium]